MVEGGTKNLPSSPVHQENLYRATNQTLTCQYGLSSKGQRYDHVPGHVVQVVGYGVTMWKRYEDGTKPRVRKRQGDNIRSKSATSRDQCGQPISVRYSAHLCSRCRNMPESYCRRPIPFRYVGSPSGVRWYRGR